MVRARSRLALAAALMAALAGGFGPLAAAATAAPAGAAGTGPDPRLAELASPSESR